MIALQQFTCHMQQCGQLFNNFSCGHKRLYVDMMHPRCTAVNRLKCRLDAPSCVRIAKRPCSITTRIRGQTSTATRPTLCVESGAMKTSDSSHSKSSGPMSPEEQAREQKRMQDWQTICDLFGRDDTGMRTALAEAGTELDREMGVRERCFPKWIDDGRMSRIDAKDRYKRLEIAQQLVNFMLDIGGKPAKEAAEDDDVPF
jgi:hypothetical protein